MVDRTHVVMSDLRLLLGLVADAESGMRGYVVTSDARYLKPYESAKTAVPEVVARLDKLMADNPSQQATLSELKLLIERRMILMKESVEASRDQGPEAGRAEVAKGEGRAVMEGARELIRKMEREESKLLAQRIDEAALGYWTAIVSSLISAVIGLALAALGFVLSNRDLKSREARAGANGAERPVGATRDRADRRHQRGQRGAPRRGHRAPQGRKDGPPGRR